METHSKESTSHPTHSISQTLHNTNHYSMRHTAITTLVVSLCCHASASHFAPRSTPSTPKEIHLAAADTRITTFHWATEDTTVGAPYALLTDAEGGTVHIQGWSHLMNTSADRQTFLHYAQSTPLSPGATYHYQVGNVGGSLSENRTFTTWGGNETRLIFFGDSGNNEIWQSETVPNITAEVLDGAVQGILHLGDMAYKATSKDGLQADIAANEISLASAGKVPIMTIPGNGEVHCYKPEGIPAWAACMKDYHYRWVMPQWEETHSMWYSFSFGPVHFLMLNSEAGLWCKQLQNLTAQLEFAEKDLIEISKKRDEFPWVVVGVHRPLYTTCNSTAEQQTMRDQYQTLFERYNVDVIISGHVHNYERTWPVTGNYSATENATVEVQADPTRYVNPKYPVSIVSGAAGNGESVDGFSGSPYNWTFSAAKSLDHGYSSMTVHNKSCVSFDFRSIEQGEIIDEFSIVKE